MELEDSLAAERSAEACIRCLAPVLANPRKSLAPHSPHQPGLMLQDMSSSISSSIYSISTACRPVRVDGRHGVQRHQRVAGRALGVLGVAVRHVQRPRRGLLHGLHPQPLLHLHVQVQRRDQGQGLVLVAKSSISSFQHE